MTEEQKPPASEAEVVEAMIRAAVEAEDARVCTEITAALTAARALGCLLPEEAAALRALKDNVVYLLAHAGPRAVRIHEGGGAEDIAMSLAVTFSKMKDAATERDALAARVRVLEDALAAAKGAPSTLVYANANGLHCVHCDKRDDDWFLCRYEACAVNPRAALSPTEVRPDE